MLKEQIDSLLDRVQKPARYMGGEMNCVLKDPKSVDIRYAFAFPDVYEVGMSHLGSRILYDIINKREDALCDLLFFDRQKKKSYVVKRARAGVKQARLSYRVLETAEERALVRVKLDTGRTHQIRVQFSSRGWPLTGDGKYGSRENRCTLALWSAELHFAHPVTGETLIFRSQPPEAYPWTLFSPDSL